MQRRPEPEAETAERESPRSSTSSLDLIIPPTQQQDQPPIESQTQQPSSDEDEATRQKKKRARRVSEKEIPVGLHKWTQEAEWRLA